MFDDSQKFERSTLYFTYFGLCCLGLGSIAFSVFCPPHIRNKPQIERYVESSQRLESAVIAKSLLRDTVDLYWENTVETEGDNRFRYEIVNITSSESASFSALIEELHYAVDLPAQFPHEEDVIDDDYFTRFTAGAGGYLNTDAVAEVLWARRRMETSLWHPIEEISQKYIKDIAYTYFRLSDVSRFWSRAIVTFIIGFGAILLFIATVRTFFLLFMSLF